MKEDLNDVDKQAARIALRNFYSDQLRHWGTNLLAIAATAIAILQVQQYFPEMDPQLLFIALGVIVLQAIYGILKIIHYARRCQCILYVCPKEQDYTYLWRLDVAVSEEVDKTRFYKIARSIRGVSMWLAWIGMSIFGLFVISTYVDFSKSEEIIKNLHEHLPVLVMILTIVCLLPVIIFRGGPRLKKMIKDCQKPT
ncbi:hypothetical protein ACFLQ6_11035 [Thermoproteota archaeon]